MGRVRVVLNSPDIEKILQHETMEALADIGDQVVDATGRPEDYEVQEYDGLTRARVTVRTVDEQDARAREARDHLLIQAIAIVASGNPGDPNRLIRYVSRAGVVSYRTQAEIDNYRRGNA